MHETVAGPRRAPARRFAKSLGEPWRSLRLELEAEGRRPVCVLTRDEAIPRLRNVVVALVTGRRRGLSSEVVLGPEDGMPRECAISLDNLRTVPRALLTEEITQLTPERTREVCRALSAVTDC